MKIIKNHSIQHLTRKQKNSYHRKLIDNHLLHSIVYTQLSPKVENKASSNKIDQKEILFHQKKINSLLAKLPKVSYLMEYISNLMFVYLFLTKSVKDYTHKQRIMITRWSHCMINLTNYDNSNSNLLLKKSLLWEIGDE